MNIYKDYKRMSNGELRYYHKMAQSRRKLWIGIPIFSAVGALLLFGLVGWSTYPQVMMSAKSGYHADGAVFGVITWLVFGGLAIFLPLEKGERQFAPAILMGAYDLVLLLFGRVPLEGLLMAGYYVGAGFALRPIVKELEFLRGLPNYPFLDRMDVDSAVEYKVSQYYESSPAMQRQKAQAPAPRAYDSSMTDEVLSTLPKRHIEEVHVKHGYFDEPEQTYTDDLANQGEPVDRLSRKEIFEEPEQLYSDKIINPHRSVDVLAHPENYFDEIDEGFKGDITKAETEEQA